MAGNGIADQKLISSTPIDVMQRGDITANIDYSLVKRKAIGGTMNKMLDDFEASIKHINEKTTELGYHVNKLALSNASDGELGYSYEVWSQRLLAQHVRKYALTEGYECFSPSKRRAVKPQRFMVHIRYIMKKKIQKYMRSTVIELILISHLLFV